MKTAFISKGTGGPLILWGADLDREKTEDLAAQLEMLIPDKAYTIAAFSAEDWNADFSPWTAEADGRYFAGKGPETLKWLTDEFIPELKVKYPDAKGIYIAGYSLAGLFALWALYETDIFDGAASCSGSLWYPGWTGYAEGHKVPEHKKVYLSLGGKEKDSRSQVLSSIEECTKIQLELLKEKHAEAVLVMNPGGHFANPMQRLAKGIAWLLGI